MKKIVIMFAMILTQAAVANADEVKISPKCLDKISQFSTRFAKANLMSYGAASVTVGNILVNTTAIALGESGFADGKGSYELIIDDEGDKTTSEIKFTFRLALEPHCSIMKIQAADVM